MVHQTRLWSFMFFFFFNDTATTEIYTLSLHDALPISSMRGTTPASAGSSPAEGRRQGLPPAWMAAHHSVSAFPGKRGAASHEAPAQAVAPPTFRAPEPARPLPGRWSGPERREF